MAGEIAAVVRGAGMHSAVASPIVVGGRVWGAMVVLSPRQEPLPEDTESRLADFTELVATAIANAESRQALSAARRRAGSAAAGGDDRDGRVIAGRGLRAVTEEAARVSESKPSGYFASSPTEPRRSSRNRRHPGSRLRWGPSFTLDGENVVAAVHRTGEAARADDWSKATGPVAAMAHVLGVRSAVAAPIVVEGCLLGHADRRHEPDRATAGGNRVRIGEFTELVATAIANAESREALAGLAAEQAALRRVAVLVAQGVPPADLFAAVSRRARKPLPPGP